MYINAKGKLRTQMLSWIIITILYIPIVIVLIKYTTMGIYSIAIGLIMSNIYYVIIAPIQYLRIIKTC